MNNSKELVPIEVTKDITLGKELDQAKKMAKELMSAVKAGNMSKNFGGERDHLELEAWQIIANADGCFLKAEVTGTIGERNEKGQIFGYKAKGYVVRKDGGVVMSEAESCCCRDEANWKTKSEKDIMSMAETRAAVKSAGLMYRWIARIAGFATTPAEEMDGVKVNKKPKGKVQTEKNATQAQYAKLMKLGEQTWPDVEVNQAKENVRAIGAWYRKGEKLTMKEAGELIDNWENAVGNYMAEQMEGDDGSS
jgi:hypothetical protein